jgi:hypothetical protein
VFVRIYLLLNLLIDDDFEYKEELFDVIQSINLKKEGQGASAQEAGTPLLLLALRFMIAKKVDYNENVFGFTDPESQHFFRMYLAYLSQFKYDDLPHWTEEELAFYNKRSFTITKDSSREDVYARLLSAFQKAKVLPEKLRGLLDGGFDEFNHWYSVVQSRAHSIKDE